MLGKTLSRRRTSSVSSARIEPLEPRRLLAAAMDSPAQFLGDVSAGYHRQIVQNVPARRTDSWGFNITQPVAVTLLADRLKHDGDLILQQTNSKGRVRTLAKSSNPGRSAERIELTLEPGRYTIILSNQATKTNSYRLTARTAEVAAPSRVEATVWSGTSAHVRWLDNSHNETGFRVQQWIRGRWKTVAEANRNATAAVVSGHLQPGHEPIFRVVARRGQAAIASTNTMTVTMNGSDESGWYRVTGLTYKGVGEAGWDDRGQTLKIRPEFLAPKADPEDPDQSIWVEASDWKMAVWTVVQGQLNVEATFDAGWIRKGDIVTHNFPSGGDFVVGTEAEIRQIGLNSTRKASHFKDRPQNKVIAVEDAYAELDRDYDDWWWEVETDFVRFEFGEKTYSDQLPGSEHNYLPGYTGNVSDYILMGTAADGKARTRAEMAFEGNATGAKQELHFAYRYYDAMSSQYVLVKADASWSGDMVSLSAVTWGDLVIVAGFDRNNNGKLDEAEIAVENPHALEVIADHRYQEAATFLTGVYTATASTYPYASDFLESFINGQPIAGATNSWTKISSGDPRLSHHVGANFDASTNARRAAFESGPGLPQLVASSDEIKEMIASTIELNKVALLGAAPPLDYKKFVGPFTLMQMIQNQVRPATAVRFDGLTDLHFAFNNASLHNMEITVELKTQMGAQGEQEVYVHNVRVNGRLEDLYDFRYGSEDALGTYGAIVQAGYPTLGSSGRIFLVEVNLSNDVWMGTYLGVRAN